MALASTALRLATDREVRLSAGGLTGGGERLDVVAERSEQLVRAVYQASVPIAAPGSVMKLWVIVAAASSIAPVRLRTA